MLRFRLLFVALLSFVISSCAKKPTEEFFFIGTYANPDNPGIALYNFNAEDGSVTFLKDYSGVLNPSYQAITKDGKFLYSVCEGNGDKAQLVAFSFDKNTLELKEINRQSTNGDSPCYVWVDSKRKLAVTANYSGGNISVFPINADGSLQPVQVINFEGGTPGSRRQSKPYLHCAYNSPDGKFLFANDLGTDHIYKFELVENANGLSLKEGTPASFKLSQGEGPRHSVFHPNGKWAYLIGELSGNVTFMEYKDGNFTVAQTIEADSLKASGSADIHITPDGKFLYASNRLKGDGIAIFSIDSKNGRLTKVGYQPTGIHPRNFVISSNGKFLLCACSYSNLVQVFAIDSKTGLLSDTGNTIDIKSPVCLKFIR